MNSREQQLLNLAVASDFHSAGVELGLGPSTMSYYAAKWQHRGWLGEDMEMQPEAERFVKETVREAAEKLLAGQ